jgi:hypothetical protein
MNLLVPDEPDDPEVPDEPLDPDVPEEPDESTSATRS